MTTLPFPSARPALPATVPARVRRFRTLPSRFKLHDHRKRKRAAPRGPAPCRGFKPHSQSVTF